MRDYLVGASLFDSKAALSVVKYEMLITDHKTKYPPPKQGVLGRGERI